jgi:predicted dehydrogenase
VRAGRPRGLPDPRREAGRAATLVLRELPALGRLAGVLRERLLGRLAGATAALAHPGAVDGWFDGPRAWMRDPARAGVGGFGDLALHIVDALVALRADEPPALHTVALDRPGADRGDVGGVAMGTWAGVPLAVRASWAARPGGLELVVTGSAGTASLREGVLELDRGSGRPERWVGPPPDAGEAVRAFANRLRARRFPRDGLAPAVEAQALLEAAIQVA